jgi:hypothetical protein
LPNIQLSSFPVLLLILEWVMRYYMHATLLVLIATFEHEYQRERIPRPICATFITS